MKLRFTERADKDYADLPLPVRKAFAKQLRFSSPTGNTRHCISKSSGTRMSSYPLFPTRSKAPDSS